MSEIDYNTLLHSIQEQIDDSIIDGYDFEALLRTATICWDGTAVQITGKDFVMVFDLINYDLLDYTGYDMIMEANV